MRRTDKIQVLLFLMGGGYDYEGRLEKNVKSEIQDKIGDIENSKVKTILRKLWQTDLFVYCLFKKILGKYSLFIIPENLRILGKYSLFPK